MKAVILAAGEGNRLRPFTFSEPKVMIPVANKPILQFVIESLVENGIKDIDIIVGYRKERIMSYFGDGDRFDANLDYITQSKQLGTAHALYQVKDRIEDDFIVLPGDNVISKRTVSDLLEKKDEYSVLITRNKDPSKYGVVSLKNGLVNDIIEKPEKSPSHLISTGIYLFKQNIFDFIEKKMNERTYDLTSVLKSVIDEKQIKGITTESTWIDVVYPWDLISVNSTALAEVERSINGKIEDNVIIKGPVHIEKDAVIRGGSYIKGPVIIGEGCEIGPNSCILPSSSIGHDSYISPFTLVRNSIIMQCVEIGSNSNIENSLIADGVKIGNNFSAHFGRADKRTVDGLQQVDDIGAMIAEDSVLGSGIVTESGIIVGASCDVKSGLTLRDDIPSNSKVV